MKSNPPSSFRSILLCCCLFLIAFLAIPVQSQATPAPTLVPVSDCGLPTGPTTWTDSTTQKVWNMTANCVMPRWGPGNAYLRVHSGEFTINGNGHSIIGGENWIVMAQGSNTILHLNNITIRGDGLPTVGIPVRIRQGATLHARDLIVRDHLPQYAGTNGIAAMWIDGGGSSATLTNVQFINNDSGSSATSFADRGTALMIWGASIEVVIDGALFRNNRGHENVVRVQNSATLRLRGCIKFENNYTESGEPAVKISLRNDTQPLDDQRGACPKKRKKATPVPWPTRTPVPPSAYRQEYTELQQETGITISAAYGLGSGVHFRQIDGAGIGIQSLIDAGPLAAMDVHGYVEQGVEICFPHVGRVIFLDAATIPRAMIPLPARVADGATCVSIDRPGSLVLLPPE